MTVGELIELLKSYNKNCNVYIYNECGDESEANYIWDYKEEGILLDSLNLVK